MRILYSHRTQAQDGAAVHIDEMVAALRAAGHEVLIVGPATAPPAGHAPSAAIRPGRLARLRRLLPGGLGELAELGYNLVTIPRLARAWKSFRPDLVYERYNLFHLAGAWLARRHGARVFLEVNSPLAAERARHGGLRFPALARHCERIAWRHAARVLPVTEVLAGYVAMAGVARERITVIPNAIVPEHFAAAAPRLDPPVLGFVGYVRDWHGLDGVIDAMAADPLPLTLDVVGDGPARPGLERRAERLGVAGRVRFLGLVPHAEVAGHVGRFGIALQPKVTPWASPLKIFDYMAAGCGIVAPDQPNIREVLTHEATALLFPPDDPAAMWQAIRRLAADPALRARLGVAARDAVLTHHTWPGNAARVVALAAEP